MAKARDHLEATAVEQATFRTVLGHFASGVSIVTGLVGGAAAGFSCQSFFSLSLDPPLISIAPGKASTSWPGIGESGSFCVNVLSEAQESVCRAFAVSGSDKFAGVGWSAGPTGSPVLHDVLAWVDCRVETVYDAGDHWLVVGAVAGMGTGPGEPLLFYRGGFGGFKA